MAPGGFGVWLEVSGEVLFTKVGFFNKALVEGYHLETTEIIDQNALKESIAQEIPAIYQVTEKFSKKNQGFDFLNNEYED